MKNIIQGINKSKMIKSILKHKYLVILSFFILIYILVFSYLSIIRYLSFNSYYYDLGIMNQVVYNTSKGRFLEMTNPQLFINTKRFFFHFDPILAFFAPFYWFFKGPEILLIGQSIFLGLGAIAVYLIAKEILGKKLVSIIFSFLYLTYYPLHRINLFDVHGVALSIPFLLFGFYFLIKKNKDNKQLLTGILFLFLALLTKENVALTILFFGLYFLIIKKQKKIGFLITVISLVFFLSTVFLIIPFFRQGGHFALKYYTINIGENIKRLLTKDNFDYFIKLLRPMAFFSLLSPTLLFIALPEFLVNMLSSNRNMINLYFHYSSVILPFIFISAIYGYNNLLKRLAKYRFKNDFQVLLLIVVVSFNLYFGYKLGPLFNQSFKIEPLKLKIIKQWQKKLSNDQLKVSSTPQLGPFFTARRYYYNFLFDPAYKKVGLTENDIIKKDGKYNKADYIIIAKWEINSKDSLSRQFYNTLIKDKNYLLVFRKKDIEVYKKINR